MPVDMVARRFAFNTAIRFRLPLECLDLRDCPPFTAWLNTTHSICNDKHLIDARLYLAKHLPPQTCIYIRLGETLTFPTVHHDNHRPFCSTLLRS